MAQTVSEVEVKVGLNDKATDGLKKVKREITLFGNQTVSAKTAVLGLGGAILGIGVWAVSAATEWESAFAGVEKTVEGSTAQLAALEEQLRDMATDTSNPLSALDNAAVTLATIAEMGGSLGVATEDLDEFVQTIGMLDMTTDMTAESASSMIAQFANITDMSVEDYDNFGSTLVDLGNKMAATEGQIMEFAQRIAAAGERAGFSEQEILAFSASMASLGLNPEAGGSAFTQAINEVVKAVALGGPKLETFAETAGMTAEAFQEGWANDPAGTFLAFLEGLSNMTGEEQLTTLAELGLSGIRVTDTMGRLAGGVDMVADSLDISTAAWEENSALMTEAEKRAQTTEGQMNALKNNLNELGITLGNALLPLVNQVIVSLTDLISNLSSGDTTGLGNNILDFAEDVADAITPLENDIQLPDFQTVIDGWTTFGQSMSVALNFLHSENMRITNDIAVGLRSFIREIEELMSRAQIAWNDLALAINPNDQVAAGIRLANIDNVNAIETAENLEAQLRESMEAGDISIDVSSWVTTDPAAIADKIADPVLIQQAIDTALAEGDVAALEVLLPIAAEMGIDVQSIVDQFAATIDEATAEDYPTTIVADVLVTAGGIDVTGFVASIQSAVNAAADGVGVPTPGSQGGGAGVGRIQHFAEGGMVGSDGLIFAHQGERVLNPEETAAYNAGINSGGGGGNVNYITIQGYKSVDEILFELKRRGIVLNAA